MSHNNNGFIIFLIIGFIIFLICIVNWIMKIIDETAQTRATQIYRANENRLINEINERKHIIEMDLKKQQDRINLDRKELETDSICRQKIFAEKTVGFPWAANAFANLKALRLETVEEMLRTKKNPSIKGADAVKEAKKLLKESEKRAFIAEGIINYYESLFPWLTELRDVPDHIININQINNQGVTNCNDDNTIKYLTPAEWNSLSNQEKYQLALDRYWTRAKSKWEIGRIYERYIGYEYENEG